MVTRSRLQNIRDLYETSRVELKASLEASESKLLEMGHYVHEPELTKDNVDDREMKVGEAEKTLKFFEARLLYLTDWGTE